jgi:bifunctional non-homologous end joining protein LigD
MTRILKVVQPSWIPPMLATLTDTLPTQGKWVYEPKLDGVRALIYVSGGEVQIYSRNRKPLNGAYPGGTGRCRAGR